MSRPIITLEEEEVHALPQRPDTPIVRGERGESMFSVPFWEAILIVLLSLGIGIVTGMKIAAPEEIRRQRAWDVYVAAYNECFDKFVKPIPRGARETRLVRSESCVAVAEVVLNEVYQATGRKP